MKRNLELYRAILLKLRDDDDPESLVGEYAEQEVRYHAWLILGDGLAEGTDIACLEDETKEAFVTALTGAGHDFVDGAANVQVWQATMEKIRVYGTDVGIQIVRGRA